MAGRGPAPKKHKARRNASSQLTEVEYTPAVQPTLTNLYRGGINPLVKIEVDDDELDQKAIKALQSFSPSTKRLWTSLADFPTTRSLHESQWLLLGPAILLFDLVQKGMASQAQMSEMRLQFAQYGITPADVLRLRINLSEANIKESKARIQTSREGSSASKYKDVGEW